MKEWMNRRYIWERDVTLITPFKSKNKIYTHFNKRTGSYYTTTTAKRMQSKYKYENRVREFAKMLIGTHLNPSEIKKEYKLRKKRRIEFIRLEKRWKHVREA